MSINKKLSTITLNNNQDPIKPGNQAANIQLNLSNLPLQSHRDLPPLPSTRTYNLDSQRVNNDEVIAKLKLKLSRRNSGESSQQSPLYRVNNNDQQTTVNNNAKNNDQQTNRRSDSTKTLSNPQHLMKAAVMKKESNFLYNFIQKHQQQYQQQQTSQESVHQESTNITRHKNHLSQITQKRHGPMHCDYCLQQLIYTQQQQQTFNGPHNEQHKAKHVLQDKLILNCARKFMIKQEYYDLKAVNSILFNQQARIVSVFKDYLIFDDVCEFLQSNYTTDQSKALFVQHVKKEKERILKFKTISQIPNYSIIEFKQLLYKNLKMKQKAYQDKLKLQKLLQQEQIQKQLDAAAMKFTGQHLRQNSKNLNFQKLIQTSLVQEYNFTKHNISQQDQAQPQQESESIRQLRLSQQQLEAIGSNNKNHQSRNSKFSGALSKLNYEAMNTLNDHSLSISKYSIGKELNLSQHYNNFGKTDRNHHQFNLKNNNNYSKTDFSEISKWFKMDDSAIRGLEYQGLLTLRSNNNNNNNINMINSQRQQQQQIGIMSQKSIKSNKKLKESKNDIQEQTDNPFQIAQELQQDDIINPRGSLLLQQAQTVLSLKHLESQQLPSRQQSLDNQLGSGGTGTGGGGSMNSSNMKQSRLLPDIPKPNYTPNSKQSSKVQNLLLPKSFTTQNNQSKRFTQDIIALSQEQSPLPEKSKLYLNQNKIMKHQTSPTKREQNDKDGSQMDDVNNYLDDDINDIIETEKSQVINNNDMFEQINSQQQQMSSSKNNYQYLDIDQQQNHIVHRRVETEIDPLMHSYDSNDYQNFFNDANIRKSDVHEQKAHQQTKSNYFKIYKDAKLKQQNLQQNADSIMQNEQQRAISQLSMTNKPPRGADHHKHTQSVIQIGNQLQQTSSQKQVSGSGIRSRNTYLTVAQSKEEAKKVYSTNLSVNTNQDNGNNNHMSMGFDRTQNFMKLKVQPTAQNDKGHNNIAAQKNKKFIQQIVSRNKRDTQSNNSNISILPINTNTTLSQQKSHFATANSKNNVNLKPMIQSQQNINLTASAQFSPSNNNHLVNSRHGHTLSNSSNNNKNNNNQRFTMQNSPQNLDSSSKMNLKFVNNMSSTPHKSIQDKPYFSSLQSSVNHHPNTTSQSRIIDHHRVSSQQNFTSTLQVANNNSSSQQISQLPKIKIIKKPKIIFNNNYQGVGPDFSRNSMISQQSSSNANPTIVNQQPSFLHNSINNTNSNVNANGMGFSPQTTLKHNNQQVKRMNRNEFISLKTRAHSYGGSGGGGAGQANNSNQGNISNNNLMLGNNTLTVKDSRNTIMPFQTLNNNNNQLLGASSSSGIIDQQSIDAGIMIQDQREATIQQQSQQHKQQQRQMIIKKQGMKPSQQIKLKVNQYKYVVRPQSNIDQYEQ